MQSPIHFHRTVSGNRLKIALISLSFFIFLVAGLYYFLSFKKSHIPLTLEGTWVCQQYLDSIAARKSVAKVGISPLFLQMSFKKGWNDSVLCTGISSTYNLKLAKISKGKYLLSRFTDTIGVVNIKKVFKFEEKWSNNCWQYAKVDTAFKRLDRGSVFRKKLNQILLSGTYRSVLGASLLKEVVFTDSGFVTGIKGIKNFKICYGADCFHGTFPKDAIFMSNGKKTLLYAFDVVKDTLTFYTIVKQDTVNVFKPYWQMVKQDIIKFR